MEKITNLPDNIRIVIADDDQDDRENFRDALLKLSIPTELVMLEDCECLHDYLKERPDSADHPDIIFLDINMPKKDGITCLKEIRADERYCKIPLVMFTTSSRPVDIDGAYDCGANLYIRKPDGFNELVNTLERLFSPQWFKKLMTLPKEKYLFTKGLEARNKQ